jgi:surfeit locus 1 family protein
MPLLKMFQRKWLLTTLLVFLGTVVCIRLGIWQLDRLEGRRAFNAQVESMRSLPPVDLNQEEVVSIEEMEWRAVRVVGEYDFVNQVALRNQYYGDQYGYHLWTPLLFDGRAVFVDRGWIPADGNSSASEWRKYDQPGEVNVSGQIRLGQTKPALGGVADALPENGGRLEIWNNGDVERIISQLPYSALPVYIQPDPDESDVEAPIPLQPELELTEGPHFGYALQWFMFASILFIGYPFYLRKQETGSA